MLNDITSLLVALWADRVTEESDPDAIKNLCLETC